MNCSQVNDLFKFIVGNAITYNGKRRKNDQFKVNIQRVMVWEIMNSDGSDGSEVQLRNQLYEIRLKEKIDNVQM